MLGLGVGWDPRVTDSTIRSSTLPSRLSRVLVDLIEAT